MSAEKDRKDIIVKALHVLVMDFRVNPAPNLETCLSKLTQIYGNLLCNPDTDKFRQVLGCTIAFCISQVPEKTVL